MIAALIICLALLLVLGVPVAFAIGLSGMAALIVNGQIPFEIIPQRRASRLSSSSCPFSFRWHYSSASILSTSACLASVNLCIGMVTPPYGATLFVACTIAGQSISDVAIWTLRPVLAMVAVLAVITLFPDAVTLLPRWLGIL